MPRTILTGGWLAITASCWITSIPAYAQLSPATWVESITLSYGTTTKEWNGSNTALPEAHTEELKAPGYDVLGSLTYDNPGPPQLVTHQEAVGRTSKGTTQETLWFEFQVVETSTPPIPVSEVPITIYVIGSAEATGRTCFVYDVCNRAEGSVSFLVGKNGERVMEEFMISGDGKKNLVASKSVSTEAGQRFNASLTCQAFVDEGPFTSPRLTATASAYATVIVSDYLISGTESKYSDFFHIEYSPGYWALGNPTPVHPTTWGKIKSLYSGY